MFRDNFILAFLNILFLFDLNTYVAAKVKKLKFQTFVKKI